jgi:hypothetical protein
LRAVAVLTREPIEDLQQLQLVVQIVLEPEHGLVVGAEIAERSIPLGEARAHFGAVFAWLGQPAGAHVRERLDGRQLRDRAVMERIPPREVGSRDPSVAEPLDDGIAVGDV